MIAPPVTTWITIARLFRYEAGHVLALFGAYRIVMGLLILALLAFAEI